MNRRMMTRSSALLGRRGAGRAGADDHIAAGWTTDGVDRPLPQPVIDIPPGGTGLQTAVFSGNVERRSTWR